MKNVNKQKLISLLPFFKTLTLLYVEDNRDGREATYKMLKNFFDNIIIGVDGEDGLKKFFENRVDLIITDINMPNMNGLEMIEKIREKSNIPILILSAHNEIDYFMKSINLGIEGYIIKPIRFEEFLNIIIKIVNRIKIEKENENYKNNLKSLVEEKTKELKEAKELAERASHIKSEYLTNMSHEIKTPINYIFGFTQLLEEKVEDEVQKEYIASIKMGVKRLLGIINNILDISKIESGELKLYPRMENTKEIFQQLRDFFELEIKEKKIDFIIEIDEKLPKKIYIDELRLKQILINLITNSIKFTNRGFVKLRVKLFKKHNNMVDIFIFVEDTGIGFTKKNRKKISKAFKQKNGQELRKFEGTGLGLSICKDLVSLMNGKISFKSRERKGTIFSIILKNIPYNSKGILFYKNNF